MSSLFAKWHPVTSDFGVIQAPLERVVSELVSWHKSIEIEYSRKEITSSFEEALMSLLPLAASKMRCLFMPTRSDWTAFFQNGIQGSDPFPPMSFLSKRMGVLAMRICCTPSSATYPATIWEVYSPESMGGGPLSHRRTICAINDGGKWRFEESGEHYPFERIEDYNKPRKRDRFTNDMLRDYLKHFNIELFSDDFFQIGAASPAVLLQRSTKIWHSPEFSLEEVAAGLPWRKT